MENKIEKVSKEDYEETKAILNSSKEFISELKSLKNVLNQGRFLKNQSKLLDNENLRIRQQIVNEARKFQQTQMILEYIFSERRAVINKHFEVIDKGLRDGDNDLIIKGLINVGDFVSKNPLRSFDEFKKIIADDNETLMLDF